MGLIKDFKIISWLFRTRVKLEYKLRNNLNPTRHLPVSVFMIFGAHSATPSSSTDSAQESATTGRTSLPSSSLPSSSTTGTAYTARETLPSSSLPPSSTTGTAYTARLFSPSTGTVYTARETLPSSSRPPSSTTGTVYTARPFSSSTNGSMSFQQGGKFHSLCLLRLNAFS
jgi:hypothetical protein